MPRTVPSNPHYTSRMNSLSRLRLASILAALSLPLGALAQQVAAPTPADQAAQTPPAQQTIPVTTSAAGSAADNPVVLSPFEVNTDKDNGYAATETLAGTRIRTNLADVASAIQVITKDFMQDINATNSGSLLQYTTNGEVAGSLGTYAGLGNGQSVDDTASLRDPEAAQRIRGLAAADNTRDFFVTDIPWDSFNVDRVDIQRGPNAILFGLGSPAGIVNASVHNAEFRDLGSVTDRFDSFGSLRNSLDYNQVLIPNTLAIRLDGLWDDERYEQKQAFNDTKRYAAEARFDPTLFKDNPSIHTSIKVKYEQGDVSADNPRITPPQDSITPWFRPVNNSSINGGTGKYAWANGYVDTSANPAAINPWFSATANQQQPIWFIDGQTSATYQIYGGYIPSGALSTAGVNLGPSSNLAGIKYSDEFYSLSGLSTFATNAGLPGNAFGQYRNESLQNPSVFNFYQNLIDGPTASQFEHWKAYNLDLTQTFFDDRVGFELSYDRQKFSQGGQNLLSNPTLNIDTLQAFQDLSVNPNFGRPYVTAGAGSGTEYISDRQYLRASLFAEIRASDYLHNDFLVKLLGTSKFNGVYSNEKYYTTNYGWQEYANSQSWDAYWTQTNGAQNPIGNRPPVSVIYLGPSLANASSASGANIPAIGLNVGPTSGNVYQFNATYKNPNGVNLTDPFIPTGSQTTIFTVPAAPATLFQNSNPANYVGWNSNVYDQLVTDSNNNNPTLMTGAALGLRETKSTAGTWQGYLWNNAIIPTLGWRYDEVKGETVNAANEVLNRNELDLSPNDFALPSAFPTNQIYKNHSTSGGLVVHLNDLFPHDPLPILVSLSYDKSSNFQVTNPRIDFFGNPISNPTGKTKDYGILLSTKDHRFSVRVTKYDTSIQNGSTPANLSGLAATILQGYRWRNVFLYQLSGYTWNTREQTNDTPGQRYFWTPAYVVASSADSFGRPVADLNGSPSVPAGATLETQAQADAHRDGSIAAWNAIQVGLDATNFNTAWNVVPTTQSALTTRSIYAATLTLNGSTDGLPVPAAQYQPVISSVGPYSIPSPVPSNITATADSESKGYEIEGTWNPTSNWRIAFNAAQTSAVLSNVGGTALNAFVAYMDAQIAGVAGDMRQFNGNFVANNEVRQNYVNWRGNYTLLQLEQGSDVPENRKWKYNLTTNYTFDHGALKGFGIGGDYHWIDRDVVGYSVLTNATTGLSSFNLSSPYYGPSESGLDLWVSYTRKLTDKITWKIQPSVRNVGKSNGLIVTSIEPDGVTWASVRVQPTQQFSLTNTFEF
jgi:hypothetical protein